MRDEGGGARSLCFIEEGHRACLEGLSFGLCGGGTGLDCTGLHWTALPMAAGGARRAGSAPLVIGWAVRLR